MNGRVAACFLLLMLLLPSAQGAVLVSESDGLTASVPLDKHVFAFCSDGEPLTIHEVSAAEHSSSFKPAGGPLIRGFSSDTCWIRISISRTQSAPKQWYLRIGKPYLDEVTLFVEQADSTGGHVFTETRLGDLVAFRQRPVADRLFVFPVVVPDEQPATFYIRIRSTSTFRVEPIDLVQLEGLRAAGQADIALYSFVFGIIFLGLFSNLMFGLRLRDTMYAYYTVYLAALLMLSMANSGLLAQWFLSDYPTLADRMVGSMMAITICSGFAFFNKAFGLGNLIPRGNEIILAFIGLQFIFGVFAALGYLELVARPTHLLGLVGVLGILLGCIWRLLRREKGFGLYMLAFSAQLCASILGLGRNLSWVSINLGIDMIILIATGVHVVLLNFAVARRLYEVETRALRLDAEIERFEIQKASIEKEHQFMSMVAHEFRTPLAIIDISAQRIAANLSVKDSRSISRCFTIREAVARQIGLMDEFLDSDRILSRLKNIDIQPQPLAEFIKSLAIDSQRVVVDFQAMQLPNLFYCDAPLLKIAVENLIKNAIKYSNATTEVVLRFSMTGDAAMRIDVIDKGMGIPKEELPNIFSKYTRGRAATSRPGIGLGLYLVSEIVRAHAGKVSVESQRGVGAHFSIVMPSVNSRSGLPLHLQ